MRNFWAFCLFTIFFTSPSQALAKRVYFKKLQITEGLSHNTVWCQLQDSYGFMWFGTTDGLNRFDGQKFIVYKNEAENAETLGNNHVQTLFEDDDKNIWVGTNSGIYIYNREKDSFTHFCLKTEHNVLISAEVAKIIQTQKGFIWIATLGQGIFLYDPKKQTLQQNSLHSSFCWDLHEDKSYNIYASSLQSGLLCFDQNGKLVEAHTSFLSKKGTGDFKINCIKSIGNNVWFGVGSNSLCVLDPQTKIIKEFSNKYTNTGSIRSILEYPDGGILLGTDAGLYVFNIIDESFTRIDEPLDLRSLSDQAILSILKDKEEGIWITTYLGGINYLAQQTKVFEYYPPTYNPNYSTGKVITQFCEDKKGNIWIGSQDGLKVLKEKTQVLEPFTISNKIMKQDIRALLYENNKLWIGTNTEGLKVLNLQTNKLSEYYHIRELPHSISSNSVLSLYKDTKDDIYIGTSWGLCKYNKKEDNFETLSFIGTMTAIFDIIEDKSGHLWFATNNSGVFRYNSNSKQWRHYLYDDKDPKSIRNNSIITIFEDFDGKIWLGTNGSGLCYYNEEDESFIDFDPNKEILTNQVIYSIEEDNLGYLWISSNNGLLRINPEEPENKKLFTQENGLQSNQFNFKASLKSNFGKLYFGGINGFNSFYPSDFKENLYIPPIYIVDIKLYNEKAEENKALLNLSKPIYLSDKIRLPYYSNNITFSFSALSYEEASKNEYAYVLEGFDKNWIKDNSPLATYTNIPPGEYIFKVKGSNNDNLWNEEGASIKVIIFPPWWKSSYAYLLYLLLAIALVYISIKYLIHLSNKRLKSQLQEYEIIKEKEIYQSKISFFINLVHEIRTPLSLIKLPLDKLAKNHSENKKTTEYLSIINRNVSYLLNTVNHLLDFQKVESKNSILTLQELDINRFTLETFNQFNYISEYKNINTTVILPENTMSVFIDKDKITKILNNLLSNAIKYANKTIELKLEIFEDTLEFIVSDDGDGIIDSEKEKVFQAFYQSKQNKSIAGNSGTGIGLTYSRLLAESHKGSLSINDNEWGGSSFKLAIPIEYNEEELNQIEFIETSDTQIINSSEENIKSSNTFKKSKILIVEDNIELLNLIEDSLELYFTVYKAENGSIALDILKDKNIDLIVSDIMMPIIDGFELTKRIKTDINYSHIPVILLTAKTTIESKIEGLEYGADVYLDKPFSIEYLQKQIENLLKLKLAYQRIITSYKPSEKQVEAIISKKDKIFLDKLHSEIEKHIADLDFSIDNIAESVFMSRSSFYRKLKNITGMSPNDYLKVFRLNKAAELLLKNEIPVSEICYKVAFSSSSYFSKCFKAQFGILPKDYAEDIIRKTKSNN